MSKFLIPLVSVIIMLSGCSDETPAVTSNDNNKQETRSVNDDQSNPLSGFKSALETAKSVTSTASENEKKKQQAIQDTF